MVCDLGRAHGGALLCRRCYLGLKVGQKVFRGRYPHRYHRHRPSTTQARLGREGRQPSQTQLLLAGIIGGLYDFTVGHLRMVERAVTSRAVAFGETIAEKAKLVVKLNTGAAVLGLGYIIGLRYAFIICMGSICVWWIIVPAMAIIFPDTVLNQWDPTITTAVGDMTPEQIFTSYARSIGIGGIAMAASSVSSRAGASSRVLWYWRHAR